MWAKAVIAAIVVCMMIQPALASSSTPASSATPRPSASPRPTATPRPTTAPKPTKAKPADSVDTYSGGTLKAGHLYAQCAVLMDAKSGKILFEKNPDKLMYPASITKLLTALVVLENCSLDDVVTVTKAATNVEPTIIGLSEGEQLSLKDLMYGMLMKSGNDAAIALAVHTAGSVEEFSKLMNEKAESLGAHNSNFANPNGLNNTKHYTTASDYALIAREAAKNEVIRDACKTLVYTIDPTNKAGRRTVENTNEFLHDSGKAAHYEYGLGMKTGYTSDAAYTYAGLAEKDGITLVSVVLGSSKAGKWADTALMMDYGFDMFTTVNLVTLYNEKKPTVTIEDAADDDPSQGVLELSLHNPDAADLTGFQINKDDKAGIQDGFSRQMVLNIDQGSLRAPILEGAPLGTMSYTFQGQTVEAQLVASRNVKQKVVFAAPGILQRIEGNAAIKSDDTISKMWWIVLLPLAGIALLAASFVAERAKRSRRTSSYSRYFSTRKTRY